MSGPNSGGGACHHADQYVGSFNQGSMTRRLPRALTSKHAWLTMRNSINPFSPGLLRVDRLIRGRLMLEIAARVLRPDRDERPRRLREVEGIHDAGRALVRRSQRAEPPHVLDELQDAAELVRRVRDVTGLSRDRLAGIRRHYQHRHAESESAPVIEHRRRLVIVEA